MQADVSIVILNYNTENLLRRFLPSVLNSSYQAKEVVVIDNNSTDESLKVLNEEFPDVRVISLENNYGFAGGYNRGLEQLNTPYWILLNSDVEVHEHWIQPMLDVLRSSDKIAAVGPKILDYFKQDHFEYAGASGGYMDKWAYPFCRGRLFDTLEKDQGQYDNRQQVFWASGAAFMVKAEEWRSLGGLDNELFAHMEEIDLCWRMNNLGKEVWICPDSRVYHMGGGTLSKQNRQKTFYNFRNNLAIILKNAPRTKLIRYLLVRLVLDGVAAVKYLFSAKWKHCIAILHAHWDFFFFIRRWIRKRKDARGPKKFKGLPGYYDRSIVKEYFIRGNKKVTDLKDFLVDEAGS